MLDKLRSLFNKKPKQEPISHAAGNPTEIIPVNCQGDSAEERVKSNPYRGEQ